MAKVIDKRSWGREPPALGLLDYRFNIDDPVRMNSNSFVLHFSYRFTTGTTARLCFAVFYDDTPFTPIPTTISGIIDCLISSCQGYYWGGKFGLEPLRGLSVTAGQCIG